MPDFIDPTQYIITRKRKKYRFAKFHNSPLCFEHEEWKKRRIDVVEVGAGDGLFITQLAKQNPGRLFAAVDVKADRLQKGAYMAAEHGLTNIYFIRARANQLSELFTPRSISELWLTFPDPYPRTRSAGRRLTHPYFLAFYKALLTPKGSIFCKHDNKEFFLWSLEQCVAMKLHITELSFNLHSSTLEERYKVMTTYEKRWIKEGSTINFARITLK